MVAVSREDSVLFGKHSIGLRLAEPSTSISSEVLEVKREQNVGAKSAD